MLGSDKPSPAPSTVATQPAARVFERKSIQPLFFSRAEEPLDPPIIYSLLPPTPTPSLSPTPPRSGPCLPLDAGFITSKDCFDFCDPRRAYLFCPLLFSEERKQFRELFAHVF